VNINPPPQIGADRQRASQQLEVVEQIPQSSSSVTGPSARPSQPHVSGIPGSGNRIQSRRAAANVSKQTNKGGENNSDMK